MSHLLHPTPTPCKGFQEAIGRHKAIVASEPDDLWPECRSVLLHHGGPSERVAIFYHGYSSCPQQFRALGKALHAQGWNVLIPRFPHHGHTDRDSSRTRHLTPEDLVRTASEAVDIGIGLGERLTVAGLSMGGLLTGWAAQLRPEVEHAVLVAPAYNVGPVPLALAPPLSALFRALPGINRAWNPDADPDEGVRHGYPHYNTRAIASLMTIGRALIAEARHQTPAAQSVSLITNENDDSIDNQAAAVVFSRWQSLGASGLQSYAFPKSMGLPHNTIEPENGSFDAADTHPMLLHLLLTGDIGPEATPREEIAHA